MINKISGVFSELEKFMISISLTLLVFGVVSMVLAICGVFQYSSVLLLFLACITVFAVSLRLLSRRAEDFGVLLSDFRHGLPLVVIIILSGCLYFSFPTSYMWSGRDYGVYIVNAIHTAETGSSLYESDSFLEEYYDEVDELIEIGYPAFYSSYEEGVSDNPGDINAQFLPLYWCMLAFGYLCAGMGGLLSISGIISLITLGVYYCFAERIFNKRVAILSTILLAICPAQIWGARITQSEQLAQLLFWLAMSLFTAGWKQNNHKIIHMAIAVIGITCFCRMDNYIVGLGVCCMGIYSLLSNQKVKIMLKSIIQYMIWLVVSLIYGFAVHYHYYMEHWERGVLKYLVLGNLLLLLLYFLLFVLIGKRKIEKNMVQEILYNEKVVVAAGCLLSVFFLGLYFVRPFLQEGMFANSLREYCWYICPLTMIFALYGIVRRCKIQNPLDFEELESLFLMMGIGLISTVLYSAKPSITMDHFWMSRRWVPINFPFLIVFGMYGIDQKYKDVSMMKQNKKRIYHILLTVCLVCIFGYVGYKDKDIWNSSAYDGMEEQYEMVCESIPDDAIVLTKNEGVAAFFKYVYGKQVYIIKDDCNIEQLQQLILTQDVYFMGGIENTNPMWGITFEKKLEAEIVSVSPEASFGYYPTKQVENIANVNLYQLKAGTRDSFEMSELLITTDLAERENGAIVMSGSGICFFGPYVLMDEGQYRITADIYNEADSEETIGTLEIVIDEVVIETLSVSADMKDIPLDFDVQEDGSILQVRFVKENSNQAFCNELILEKCN